MLDSLFKDLLVIDLSTVLAGPSVATFFAELGAKVIKIENEKIPDVTRSWKLPSEDETSNISAYFSSINFKKTYQKANLKAEEDYQKVLDLIQQADILISNFKKGDDVKFRLEDERLQALNPRLIIGKINGFGTESDRVAYDLILQAESGFMSMNGTKESGPVKMPVALIDVLAAHHLKEALLLSLINRTKTNTGNVVSVSLYEAAVCSLVNQASNYLMGNQVPKRIGSLHPNIAPYGEIFKTKDGLEITFAIGSEQHFQKLCDVLELFDLPQNELFSSNQKRVINRELLFPLLQEKIGLLTAEEIHQEMLRLYVPCGIIRSIDKVFEDEKAQKLIREEEINGLATKRLTSIAFEWKS